MVTPWGDVFFSLCHRWGNSQREVKCLAWCHTTSRRQSWVWVQGPAPRVGPICPAVWTSIKLEATDCWGGMLFQLFSPFSVSIISWFSDKSKNLFHFALATPSCGVAALVSETWKVVAEGRKWEREEKAGGQISLPIQKSQSWVHIRMTWRDAYNVDGWPPELLLQEAWWVAGGGRTLWEFALLSTQEMLMLLVWDLHFENYWSRNLLELALLN